MCQRGLRVLCFAPCWAGQSVRNQTTHWISGLNVCVFSTSPVSDLRSDSAGLSKIDAARGMGPGWISGLESGCDGWQKFDQSGDLQVSEVRTAARCPWPPSVQLNDQFAPIFVRNFWSNFLFSKYLTDSNGPWYGGRNLYESVISLLCFRIFLIEI